MRGDVDASDNLDSSSYYICPPACLMNDGSASSSYACMNTVAMSIELAARA